ncbi:SDR family NAD(P)-dependent oxidoreductase [Marinimicrobium locisalis]|uniref:SDR family NAD(P)-dependent oxidoreductase n=1 Tax=Marinimicrobium locisalis TaxID=546022 RepID=UPI00322198C7
MSKLKGKVALVTGGSRGMGAAICERLAHEGADVALTYNRSENQAYEVAEAVERFGRRGLALRADSRDPEAVKSSIEKTVKQLGKIDILVNNAGVFNVKAIDALTLEDYRETMDTNVRAAFVASKAAAEHMGEGGRIISIGSNLAEHAIMPGLSLYSMSKAALTGFTKGLARDLGQRKITVNVVHPGSTNTTMNPADGEFSDAQRSAMCIPRYAEPGDIAGLVSWLASEEARCITGAGITMDGGTNA